MAKRYFITGIDTDCGKTVATGVIARALLDKGSTVVTQKLVQTGCEGIAEDIFTHRLLMDTDLYECDFDLTTGPYVFKHPASPHLAAAMQNKKIDVTVIDSCSDKLASQFDYLLIEGAGGVYVPIVRDYHIIDFIEERKYPVILVSSSKLGSINHTLLTLNTLKDKGVEIAAVVYNELGDADPKIAKDSITIIERWIKNNLEGCQFVKLPPLAEIVAEPISIEIDL